MYEGKTGLKERLWWEFVIDRKHFNKVYIFYFYESIYKHTVEF